MQPSTDQYSGQLDSGAAQRHATTLKPRPHQQQCRSNRQHCRSYVRRCRSNIRLCCHKRQQCPTSIIKFRPFDKVECCFDIVAVFGNSVERNFVLSTKDRNTRHLKLARRHTSQQNEQKVDLPTVVEVIYSGVLALLQYCVDVLRLCCDRHMFYKSTE